MIQSIEDQGALQNIRETLERLVEDVKQGYEIYGIPTDENEIRKLITMVNETAISENNLMGEIKV
jgi:coenzyme F420-reducing hydrogenase gamma subunit